MKYKELTALSHAFSKSGWSTGNLSRARDGGSSAFGSAFVQGDNNEAKRDNYSLDDPSRQPNEVVIKTKLTFGLSRFFFMMHRSV